MLESQLYKNTLIGCFGNYLVSVVTFMVRSIGFRSRRVRILHEIYVTTKKRYYSQNASYEPYCKDHVIRLFFFALWVMCIFLHRFTSPLWFTGRLKTLNWIWFFQEITARFIRPVFFLLYRARDKDYDGRSERERESVNEGSRWKSLL